MLLWPALMAHSVRLWLETREVLGSNPGRVGCLLYARRQTVQRPGVCSAVCGTVHYEEPLKSFDKSRA